MSQAEGRIRKMRRTLSLMVEGDFGLVEGEVWWMDDSSAIFWCAELLDAGARHGARVDLGVRGKTTDILFKVDQLFPRKQSRVKRGFVLSAHYELRRPDDVETLHERLMQINPEFAREKKTRRPAAPARTPVSADSQSRPGRRVEATSPPSSSRQSSPPHPAPSSSSSSQDPLVMMSPGRPPSLLVRFQAPSAFTQCVDVSSDAASVSIEAKVELSSGDAVLLVLQTPAGEFIQASATAERIPGKRFRLNLSGLSPTQLGQLKKATSKR